MDTNEISTALATHLAGYFEQVKSAAFHEGRIAGRKEARDELRLFFDKFELEPVEKRERKPRAARAAEEEEAVWLPPDQVAPLVKGALERLQFMHEAGASPQTIAEHLRPTGQPINIQAVRQALRLLTMQGEVRRVAHARYLPAAPQPVAIEPQPEAAE